MKKKILFGALLLSYFAQAQINLEQTFPTNESFNPFATSTDFFYTSNTSSSLKIYNSDYSLRKTINLVIPDGYRLDFFVDASGKSEVSKNIFNTDDKYEFIVFLSNRTTNDYKMLVVNEDGDLVFDFSSTDPNYKYNHYRIFNDPISNKNKILVTYSSSDFSQQIQKVFTLPSTTLSLSEAPKTGEIAQKLFPIPTKSLLTFKNPESGSNTIEIFDATGKKILTKEYNTSAEDISINVENLTNGIYVLKSGNYSSKFIKE
ncbi:T9SS type A sorting domain-containing protein [Flavobacterium sp.]|uniref:T9SS type A sorting domain-containing protein n=1 Tax=Flavobacterium sp. TaxID=239 RepID=UPI003D0CC13B